MFVLRLGWRSGRGKSKTLVCLTAAASFPTFQPMDDHPAALDPVHPRRMSGEALIGTGITIWAIGVLLLLLGWAQCMREEGESMTILLAIGALLFLGGGVIWMKGSGQAKRRLH